MQRSLGGRRPLGGIWGLVTDWGTACRKWECKTSPQLRLSTWRSSALLRGLQAARTSGLDGTRPSAQAGLLSWSRSSQPGLQHLRLGRLGNQARKEMAKRESQGKPRLPGEGQMGAERQTREARGGRPLCPELGVDTCLVLLLSLMPGLPTPSSPSPLGTGI